MVIASVNENKKTVNEQMSSNSFKTLRLQISLIEFFTGNCSLAHKQLKRQAQIHHTCLLK